MFPSSGQSFKNFSVLIILKKGKVNSTFNAQLLRSTNDFNSTTSENTYLKLLQIDKMYSKQEKKEH